jgi:dipeptidyl aminopeptidase/acylaminoacyl peptidase
MTRRQFTVLCCMAGTLAIATFARGQDAPRETKTPELVEQFFRYPQFSRASLSPNGQLIGVVVPRDGRGTLEVVDLKQGTAFVLTSFGDADVTDFRWVNDHRLVIFIADLQKGSGQNSWRGFYATNVDGTHLRAFGLLGKPMWYAASYDDGSDDVLVTTKEYDESVDALRLNTLSGSIRSLVYGVPHLATSLRFDHRLGLRALVVDSSDAKRAAVWYRPSVEAPWTVLADFDITRLGFNPVTFSADDQTLYVAAEDGDGEDALFAYDVEQRKLGDKLIARRGFDVNGGLIFARAPRELLGIRIEADRPETVWFSQDMARAQASVDAALPGTINELSGDPRGPLLVFAHSDTDPGHYYLFDAQSRRLDDLFRTMPWIEPERMSAMQTIRYPARDGLAIPAYLTLPRGKPAAHLPLVALIHGGPYVRDHWGFNPEVQFLASLGYAVLQPNYRGSTGYGSKHFLAGWRTWGLAMQDDITDGIEYLAAQGLIDRHRVCIMGASYGGYAALMGLIKEPELFRCGVDVSGPSDIGLEFTAWSDFSDSIWQRYGMRQLVGDPDTMRDQFQQTSPLRQAGRIKAPVLLVHGEKDWRVPIKHATRMRDALDEHHATYQWLELPGEGHGFLKGENRTRFYNAVEQFLRKYNPPE